jgi:hypothetical protein
MVMRISWLAPTGKGHKTLVALHGVRRGDSHLVQGPAADRTT